jgi:dipeptidyl aminopeptidase/acylaminoacyl peptidase
MSPADGASDINRTVLNETVYRAYLDRHHLVTKGKAHGGWTDDGGGYWFVGHDEGGPAVLIVNLADGLVAPLIDLDRVAGRLGLATGLALSRKDLTLETLEDDGGGLFSLTFAAKRWIIDPQTSAIGSAEEVHPGLKLGHGSHSRSEHLRPRQWQHSHCGGYLVDKADVDEQLSPDKEWFASVEDSNLVLRSTRDGRLLRLTTDGTDDVFWDIDSARIGVLQGRNVCVFRNVSPWSPNSLSLLAYKRDITGVFRIPRMHWLKPFEEVDFTPFHKAGARIDRIQPYFVDIRSGRRTKVDLGEVEDFFIQSLGWKVDGSALAIIRYSRDMKLLDVILADPETGATRTILTETSDTAVKIQHEAVFSGEHGMVALPGGAGFLWISNRSGWNHIYRYDWDGNLVGQLTAGDWPVYEILKVAEKKVFFTAALDHARPYDLHVCVVPSDGGEVLKLTEERGIHRAEFGPSDLAFLDTHSAVDRPPRTELRLADGSLAATVAEADITALKSIGYRAPEEFVVLAADGITELWGVLYKPHDFDPAKSYPVIESIYAGPQAIMAQRYFAVDEIRHLNLLWALAQRGYVTLCLDGRGTPGRSKAFHDAAHDDFLVGLLDHQAAMKQLCDRHTWLDRKRVGITGHSWGGMFSTMALIEAPETYRVAVSSEPGYDPWHTILSEPYLGFPKDHRDRYERIDPARHAHRLAGNLMIITGTRYNGVTGPAIRMTRALIDAGIDHEFVMIPDATHGFIGSEEDYYFAKLSGWFDRHLKGPFV